jgi:NADPH-dependent 2,4-dienoyl-CoA reductase/sulfur reductase-like enzyme
MASELSFEIVVVGAGPAGLAAAYRASQCGKRVAILDDNPSPGGQIWRASGSKPSSSEAALWLGRVRQSPVEVLCGCRVVASERPRVLSVDRNDELLEVRYEKLVLATGARERFLPFPGWTLPNVMGAGGLQALVKGGLSVAGKTVAVAGTGPLLLAVAALLKKKGARISIMAEQAPFLTMARFGMNLLFDFGKLRDAIRLQSQLLGVPYRMGCWPTAGQGGDRLEAVSFTNGSRTWTERCDYLACGFGLLPNIELPQLLGCEARNGAVVVDEMQQTSIPGVYSAGEATGVAGLDLSLAEGQIAGWAASGDSASARKLFVARDKALGFKRAFDRAFVLRPELKQLPREDTLVCRCEDVPFSVLRRYSAWRSAKLETRCGMGPCQGRICGAATEFLFGWPAQSVRPPILPTRVANLIHEESLAESHSPAAQ